MESGYGAHVGTVTRIAAGQAAVRFQRGSMCAHCGACLAVGEKELEMLVPNTLAALVGDRVSVTMEARRVVQASLLAYMIPLVLLLAGVWAGSLVSDVMALALGVAGCGISFFILRWTERKRKRTNAFQPRMTAIIGNAEAEVKPNDE